MVSLCINYAISGLNAWSYHLFNLLLHVGNVFLVFVVSKKLFGNNILPAGLVALLFGIHPMHVESVAWISERKDVLYVLFFLLALLQYLKYIEKDKSKYLVYTALFFLLSLFSKPAAITLAPILLLLDWYRGRKITIRVLLEKIPFFLIAFFDT